MKYRAEFLALSNAPITLSFHGFPGTMGGEALHHAPAREGIEEGARAQMEVDGGRDSVKREGGP